MNPDILVKTEIKVRKMEYKYGEHALYIKQ